MDFLAKVFKNSRNGQRSIVIPKGADRLKIDKLPDVVRVKISVPKDYLAKVKK